MAAVYDERYDWDHLSDEDWNKRLDEKVEEFNRGRGEVVLPPPSFAIMDDEYVRGINYKYVTEDLIRHFADAIGDPSPFWRDPSYIASTRWGGFIAPPTSHRRFLRPASPSVPPSADVSVSRELPVWPAAASTFTSSRSAPATASPSMISTRALWRSR